MKAAVLAVRPAPRRRGWRSIRPDRARSRSSSRPPICHSDIHYMEGAWGGTLPAVFGHEAAGVVGKPDRAWPSPAGVLSW